MSIKMQQRKQEFYGQIPACSILVCQAAHIPAACQWDSELISMCKLGLYNKVYNIVKHKKLCEIITIEILLYLKCERNCDILCDTKCKSICIIFMINFFDNILSKKLRNCFVIYYVLHCTWIFHILYVFPIFAAGFNNSSCFIISYTLLYSTSLQMSHDPKLEKILVSAVTRISFGSFKVNLNAPSKKKEIRLVRISEPGWAVCVCTKAVH